MPPEQLMLLPLLMDYQDLPDENVGGAPCRVFRATPKEEAISGLKIPRGTLQLWVRTNDNWPLRLGWRQGKDVDVQVDVVEPKLTESWPVERWKFKASDNDKHAKHFRDFLGRQPAADHHLPRPAHGPAGGHAVPVEDGGRQRPELPLLLHPRHARRLRFSPRRALPGPLP